MERQEGLCSQISKKDFNNYNIYHIHCGMEVDKSIKNKFALIFKIANSLCSVPMDKLKQKLFCDNRDWFCYKRNIPTYLFCLGQ